MSVRDLACVGDALAALSHDLARTLQQLDALQHHRLHSDLRPPRPGSGPPAAGAGPQDLERLAGRCLETGTHTPLTAGVVNLLNQYHERRHEWETPLVHTLADVRRLLQQARGLLGIEADPAPRPWKRPRPLEAPAPPPPTSTASQCRIWDTVLPQSALCPDVAALHDVHHPSACLYAERWDRAPVGRPADGALSVLHLGFFTSTILSEFCALGPAGPRFTFVHVLGRMGFDRDDVNAEATVLDDTFYRRILTDLRLSFLAETQSPKLTL